MLRPRVYRTFNRRSLSSTHAVQATPSGIIRSLPVSVKNGPRYRRPRPAAEQQDDPVRRFALRLQHRMELDHQQTPSPTPLSRKPSGSFRAIWSGTERTKRFRSLYGVSRQISTRGSIRNRCERLRDARHAELFRSRTEEMESYVTTDDIPAHIAFTYQKLRPLE